MISLGLVVIPTRKKRRRPIPSEKKRALLERQVGQCLLCGHAGISLEVHHVHKLQHGGSDRNVNLMGVCRQCHALINRAYCFNPVTRVALILQVLGPESMLVALICRALFACFQKSRIDFGRYNALRLLRPATTEFPKSEREAA